MTLDVDDRAQLEITKENVTLRRANAPADLVSNCDCFSECPEEEHEVADVDALIAQVRLRCTALTETRQPSGIAFARAGLEIWIKVGPGMLFRTIQTELFQQILNVLIVSS